MSTIEKYLPPGELSLALRERFGLFVTTDYVRAIRTASIYAKDGTFIAGCARPSELVEWIRKHPEFRRRSVRVAVA